MKTLLAVCTALLCMVWHGPVQKTAPSFCAASPHPVVVHQNDGSVLTVLATGNAAVFYQETEDGYTIVENRRGIYEYALPDARGNLEPSGIKAKDVRQRTVIDHLALANISKHLRRLPEFDSQQAAAARQASGGGDESSMRFPAEGQPKVLVLLIQYPDLPNTYASADFDALMNEEGYAGTGSFRDYFLKNSQGSLDLQTDVFGWYTAAQNYNYYGYQNGFQRARILMGEAIDAAEAAGVDFSQYDNDGDGKVDAVVGIHAGPGAEMGAQMQYIWSHRWDLGSQVRTYDGVTLSDYIINPETRSWGMVGVGVICHEFGHVLGLPDLYDIDNSSRGIGNWGLMGNGSWLDQEQTPANMCAWSKFDLGWIEPQVIESGAFALEASDDHSGCYRINTQDPDEFFLLENRQKIGNDTYLPGHGLAVWHVNERKTALYPSSNGVNSDESNKGVDLEEADGLDQLDGIASMGDGGDLFPGNAARTVFDGDSHPSSDLSGGDPTDIAVTDIYELDGVVYFRLNDPVACSIDFAIAGDADNCNSGTYDLPVTIYHHDAPGSGTLVVNGQNFDIGESPQTVWLTGLQADGSTADMDVHFSAQPDCVLEQPDAFTAPRAYTQTLYQTTCQAGEAGTETLHLTSASGCDSTVTVVTTLLPSYDLYVHQITCREEESGISTHTYTAQSGCDSVVTVETVYEPVGHFLVERTTCDESEAGTATYTFQTADGCDSLVTEIVEWVPPSEQTLHHTTCDPAEVRQETLYLQNEYGCDSVVHLNVELGNSYTVHLEEAVCEAALAGETTYQYTSAGGCDSTVTIRSVFTPSDVAFEVNVQDLFVDFENRSGSWDQFFWIFGDGTGSVFHDPVHTYAAAGSYTVILMAWNISCGTFDVHTLQVNVSDATGASGSSASEPPLEEASLRAFPNPTFGDLHVQATGFGEQPATVKLLDGNGRIILEDRVENAGAMHRIDLSSVGPGIYILHYSDHQTTVQTRVVRTN